MSRQYQSTGGFVNETGARQYQSSGGFRNETAAGGSALTLDLSDSISFSDTPANQPGKVLSDTIALAAAISFLTGRTLSDSIAFIDTLSTISGSSLSDTITIADSVVAQVGKVLGDSIEVTDSVTAELVLLLALLDAFEVTDSILSDVGIALSDSIDTTDTIDIEGGTPFEEAIERIALPTLDICGTVSRRTAPPTTGCSTVTRRTGAPSGGCVTVTRRANTLPVLPVDWTSDLVDTITVTDTFNGSNDASLSMVDTFVVTDDIYLITDGDPPVIDGCTDVTPNYHESAYWWAVLESESPNTALTAQQIACAVALVTIEAAQAPGLEGLTFGNFVWIWNPNPGFAKSGVEKAASDNCDPNNPVGNSVPEVSFTGGHWALAIAVCLNGSELETPATDSFSVGDSMTLAMGRVLGLSDSITASDESTQTNTLGLVLTDTITITDAYDTLPFYASIDDWPSVPGCPDEFPLYYEGNYVWGIGPGLDPNVFLTPDQIACHRTLHAIEFARDHPGMVAVAVFFGQKDVTVEAKSMASKSAFPSCDPDSTDGDVTVLFEPYATLFTLFCSTP